jgi:hypothetical protein
MFEAQFCMSSGELQTPKLSIATITWARNEDEVSLLQSSLTQLSEFNVPIFVTDAGSTMNFTEFLLDCKNINLHPEPVKGVWPQTNVSLTAAYRSGSEFVLYTEPDKLQFFSTHLQSLINRIEVKNKTGVVLYSRTTNAFNSFPAFQQMTETAINNCCAELLGNNTDYTYGLFILRREIIPVLSQLPENIGWGWRPFAFNLCKRLRYDVECMEGDFFCPHEQTEDHPQERVYRMKQLKENIEGLVLSTTASLL